ncbi:MAG: tetratricopeptide repeat protein, partial [Cyanobacteriota bacterium]
MLINKGFKQFISFSLSLIMLFSIYLPALSEVNITQYSVNIMGQTFGNLDELYVKATKYVNNKQPDEALVYLQEILKYAPNDHSVYFTMGACYILKKDYQQAIPYLLKAYQLNPIELLYAYSIGNAYFEIKNYNEAIIYLKRATASFNSDTKRNARRYLAEAYYMTKDYTNSEKVFQKLSKGHPDSLYYKKMIACCKFFNKEHNESTILFEDILTKNNQDADVHYYLAANYLIKSELNKAAMHLNTAKKINPAYQKEADSLLAQYTPDKVSLQQPSKQKTLTQQNIISSTPLYTAAIVPANEEALKLAQKHANITKDIVKNIEVLTTKLLLAKQLNEEFMQLTSDQLVKWKNFSDANSSLELLYNKEIDNFNYVFKYQAQEELKWAVIISLLEEIEKLNAQDKTAINKSSAKSFLYSSLLILEIDLVDFYKDKYSNVFYNVAVNHAFQESPNLEIKVPEKVKEQIIPLHEKELAYIELLFINIAAVLETSETLEDKTIEITDLFNDINQYT